MIYPPLVYKDLMEVNHSVKNLLSLIDFNVSLLNEYIEPQTISVGDAWKAHVDLEIAVLNRHKELTGWLEYPFAHVVSREYRNSVHHSGSRSLFPHILTEEKRIDFIVWPILFNKESIKKRWPEWCRRPNPMTLRSIVEKDYEFVSSALIALLSKIDEDNVIRERLRLPEICFGKYGISHEDAWELVK